MESRARRQAGMRESPLGPAGMTRSGARLNRRSALETTALSRAYLLRIFLGLAFVALVVTQSWLWRARPQQPNNGWMHHLRQFDPKSEAEDPLAPPPTHEVPAVAIDALEASGVMAPAALAERRAKFDPANHNADQKQVVDMIKWAWKGYETYAFGHDSLNVKTMTGTGLPGHDMALTLVDSLDTLYLVGMFDEFDRASQWVAANMDQRIFLTGFISLFETTIRLLGGLLSSYYLSGSFGMCADWIVIAAEELTSADYQGRTTCWSWPTSSARRYLRRSTSTRTVCPTRTTILWCVVSHGAY
jgi:hypothetical protein